MKLLDKIMRLFGYENIENIHIYDNFKETPPSEEKMRHRRWFYEASGGHFLALIVIKKEYVLKGSLMNGYVPFLIDGYTSYLIAKENNIKYVKVVRV